MKDLIRNKWKYKTIETRLILQSGISLKLPDECGPTISDQTKQRCRNKRSMITPETWTFVIINNIYFY